MLCTVPETGGPSAELITLDNFHSSFPFLSFFSFAPLTILQYKQ